jgi:ubiquinone/menaquinone biosynthesis C-methylase UbiE
MPTIEQNRATWDGYDWGAGGEEWSEKWGTSAMQWHGVLLPRIRSFLPAPTILDLAPGFGRWSYHLKDWCQRLVLVDLSEKALRGAHERLSKYPQISFFLNDGRSLAMIPDGSVDLVFSFDSLVHVDDHVIEGYVAEIAKKLAPDGVAFVHHSNLGAFPISSRVQGWMFKRCPRVLEALIRSHVFDNVASQWRGASMTAAKMRDYTARHGLACVSQELVTWTSRRALIDCISTFARPASRWARENRVFENPRFMADARTWSELARLYDFREKSRGA